MTRYVLYHHLHGDSNRILHIHSLFFCRIIVSWNPPIFVKLLAISLWLVWGPADRDSSCNGKAFLWNCFVPASVMPRQWSMTSLRRDKDMKILSGRREMLNGWWYSQLNHILFTYLFLHVTVSVITSTQIAASSARFSGCSSNCMRGQISP